MAEKIKKECPKCQSTQTVKAGIVRERQRFRCKDCGFHFSVSKSGKSIDGYYVIKALQLYLEGLSYREIERILGVSHVTIINWARKYQIKRPEKLDYHPSYKILSHKELESYLSHKEHLKGHGLLITEVGDKYMVIKWERFRE